MPLSPSVFLLMCSVGAQVDPRTRRRPDGPLIYMYIYIYIYICVCVCGCVCVYTAPPHQYSSLPFSQVHKWIQEHGGGQMVPFSIDWEQKAWALRDDPAGYSAFLAAVRIQI